MIEEKKRYCSGNTFNNLAYDVFVKKYPEIEQIIEKALAQDIANINTVKFERITLNKAGKRATSTIGCAHCGTTLDSSLIGFIAKDNKIFKCGNCGYEFFEYNQRISQLEHTNCGVVFRALQGIEYFLTRTIEAEWAKYLDESSLDNNPITEGKTE